MISVEKNATMTRLEVRPLLWSLLAMLYLSAFLASSRWALVLLGFVSFQALKEYCSIMPLRRSERSLVLLGYLAIPVQFYWVGVHSYALALGFVPFLIFVLAAWLLTTYTTKAQAFNSILKLGWGLFTLVLGFSHVGLLLLHDTSLDSVINGRNLLLYLLLLVHAQVLLQAILARLRVNEWARPLLHTPLVGLGGILSILGVGLVAWSLGPWLIAATPLHAMISGLLIGGGAYLGSFTIWSIQQTLEISEGERLTTGLGGILTYVYPLAYAAPLFFYYVNLFF